MRFERYASQPGVKCPQDIALAFLGDRQRLIARVESYPKENNLFHVDICFVAQRHVQDSKGQERAL